MFDFEDFIVEFRNLILKDFYLMRFIKIGMTENSKEGISYIIKIFPEAKCYLIVDHKDYIVPSTFSDIKSLFMSYLSLENKEVRLSNDPLTGNIYKFQMLPQFQSIHIFYVPYYDLGGIFTRSRNYGSKVKFVERKGSSFQHFINKQLKGNETLAEVVESLENNGYADLAKNKKNIYEMCDEVEKRFRELNKT